MLNLDELIAGADEAINRRTKKVRNKARPFFTIDCETDPFKRGRIPIPFVWNLYTGEKHITEWAQHPLQIMEFLSKTDCVVYAHNGGKFDYHYLTQFFTPGRVSIVNGRLASFRIGNAELRDSYMLFPAPLSAYKKDEFDYSKLESDVRALHTDEIETYIKNDCAYLWLMLDEFFNEYGREFTQAGAAMRMMKRICEVEPPKTTKEFYARFRPYYYGGRVQCFEHGDIRGDFRSADINSAYPYAMMHAHAFGSANHQVRNADPEKSVDAQQMFWTVTAESRGAFPYRAANGALYYPDARYDWKRVRRYHVTGWELITALETDTATIHRVHFARRFEECRDFRDYVTHFWQMKNDAEKGSGRYWFAKIFLNALYGKFAANPERYRDAWFSDNPDELADWLTLPPTKRYGKVVLPFGNGFIIQRPLDSDRQRFYNVATGASITGFVRAYLWRHLHAAERPLYCDTDSITAEAFHGMKVASELGAWEIEGEYDRCLIGGKKLYAMHARDGAREDSGDYWRRQDWKIASKGVRVGPQDIAEVCAGKRVTYSPEVPTYSARGAAISFTSRDILQTGEDIRRVPKGLERYE